MKKKFKVRVPIPVPGLLSTVMPRAASYSRLLTVLGPYGGHTGLEDGSVFRGMSPLQMSDGFLKVLLIDRGRVFFFLL